MQIINSLLLEARLQDFLFYVDMDNVLTDFNNAFESLGFGKEQEYKNKQSEFFKILNVAGESFWGEMNWKNDGKELWNFVKKYNPIILSAPTRDPSSKTGKIKWIKRELGSNTKYILDKDKFKYASCNSILIDDSLNKIEPWKKNGGIGILHTSTKDTIEQLLELKRE